MDSRLAAEQALAKIQAGKDFARFVDTHCMMWMKEGGDPIPFKLWEFQKDACFHMQNDKKAIFLKARQMGLSWLAMCYVVWSVLYKKNFHVYITSVGLKEVQEQMERIRFIWYNLPDYITGDVVLGGKGCKDNDSLIQFTNGSAIHAIASSRAAGHGAAPGLYILDEFARKSEDKMAWRAIKPSIGQNTQVFIISTSDGFNNLFAELWFDATNNKNDFVPIFYSAVDHPLYTPEYLLEQKRDFAGDLQGYMEAFPMKPEDAFVSSSRNVFDVEILKQWKDYIRENDKEPKIGRLEEEKYDSDKQVEKFTFVEDERDHLLVWAEPVMGHRYTMGVDVALALTQKSDFSASVVYDVTTDEIVALLRGRFPQETYSGPVLNLAKWYNNAWLVVEVNKGSDLLMDDIKSQYAWLYTRQVREKITDKPTLVAGFYTGDISKGRIISQLRRKISDHERPLRIYSDVILNELMSFEQNDKMKLGAPAGHYDDTVIATALALEGVNTMPDTTIGLSGERSNIWPFKVPDDNEMNWRML